MKKVLLASLLFFTLLLLTGCGASVTSQTKFQQDGSGTRTISAVISASDAKNIDGGFYELDLLLEDAAPEGISVGRKMLENGDALYQFSFHFNTIAEYNQKISKIIGEEHNATWYSNSSVFSSDIVFSEEECTYDLIAWALDAFKESKYAKFSSHFTLYKVDKSEVYYNDELVFTGTTNPTFKVKVTPKVKQVSMYSDYNYDGTSQKKLVIDFEKDALEAINIEDAKAILDAYSKEYKIDLANSRITYTLTGNGIRDFFIRADLNCNEEDIVYNSVYNPFQKKYEIKESYNLKDFLSMFELEYPYIYNYIKVPEVIADSRVSYLNHLDNITVPGGYHYAGAYRYDSTYTVDIYSNQMVDLKGLHVSYQVNKELESKRVIQVQFSKNGCFITEKELLKYYPNINEQIAVTDNEDSIKIEFTSKVKAGESKSKSTSNLAVNRMPRRRLKYIQYQVVDELNITNYLPVLEGYAWKKDKINYDYKVTAAKELDIDSFAVEEKAYQKADTSLQQINAGEEGFVVKGQATNVEDRFYVNITLTTMYDLYYFWMIVIIFLIIVTILGAVVVYVRRRESDMKDEL